MESDRLLELRFPARPTELRAVRSSVQDAAERLGFPTERAHDVVLAVDEACQNIIRHAYGGPCDAEIALEIDREDDRMVIRLRDRAPRVDESKVEPRDLDDIRPGGLGVHFIRTVMDDCGFEICDEEITGNCFRMVKRIG